MPARDFPNVGLKGGYDEHEAGWADDQNLNLLTLSVLTQGTFEEKLAAVPGAPAPGTVIVLDETNVGHPNAIAVFEGPVGAEVWTYIVPKEGWLLYNQDADYYEKFDGAVWAELATGGGGGAALEIEEEGVSVDAATVKINFVGASVTATQTAPGEVEVALGGGGGGGGGTWAWHLEWSPIHNEPPSANYATLDTRNNRPVLDFDTATQEAAIFTGILPSDYAGGGVSISLWCSMSTAVAGTVGWDVSFERTEAGVDDIDADSFAAAQAIAPVAVPGTSGMVLKMVVNINHGASMDNLAAGELFRIRIRRDVANDTAAGDAELLRVAMVEQ